jgi:hypothetical protein
MAKDDFKLLLKVEDMMVYGFPLLDQFPKNVRFSLAQEIRACMIQVLRLTITVETKKSKLSTLEYLDTENKTLMHLLRVSMDLKFLSKHHYGVWEAKLVEIGKMIGGLLRSVSSKPKS